MATFLIVFQPEFMHTYSVTRLRLFQNILGQWSGLKDFFWFFEMEELGASEANDYNWSYLLNCFPFKEIKGLFLIIKIRQIIDL